ncbi:alpha/beta-hydrolase [Lentinus brumalis]|uniref:Alpha/beta-hydrolase n=1 Tax=Lentinus brumalis TaxID=2498619 RepID=A0A371CS52_9APHY|nr:alpha/beta-hydrolase [Polyporus brumalis]
MSEPSWPGLPEEITSRSLAVRDLELHILEAGDRTAPLVLLLHGFPELSYSWRNIIVPLSRQGYRVVAPDGRGYGRTKPNIPGGDYRPVAFQDDLHPYRMLNLAHDVIALVAALGYTSVAVVIGHDFGSTLAGYCAVARPDLFRSVILMSAPFTGAPALPFATDSAPDAPAARPVRPWLLDRLVDAGLAQLNPPHKHYTHYFSDPSANAEMTEPPQGLYAFLRAYFHMKSADWEGNDPQPLPVPPTAEGLARLPHYYVMPRDASMADVVREGAPSAEEVQTKSARWLPNDVLGVYVSEYGRTGFQGGLNKYRGMINESTAEELSLFSGKKVEIPAMYLSGKKDWGVFQQPGALEKMRTEVFTRMAEEDVVLIDGAGHWVQQEQPQEVMKHIQRFIAKSL